MLWYDRPLHNGTKGLSSHFGVTENPLCGITLWIELIRKYGTVEAHTARNLSLVNGALQAIERDLWQRGEIGI